MSRLLRLTLVASASLAATACVSLLGDFDSTSGDASAPDASPLLDGAAPADAGTHDATTLPDGAPTPPSDAAVDTGGGLVDAGVDGAIPLTTLSCTTWKLGQPAVIASLDSTAGTSNGNFFGLTSFAAGATTSRIVAVRNTAAVLFTVYSVDTSGASPKVSSSSVSSGDAGSGMIAVVGAVPILGGFGVLVKTSSTNNGTTNIDTLWLYPFRDASPVSPAPSPIALTQFVYGNLQSAAVLELASNTYFVAASGENFTSTSTSNSLGITVSSGGHQAQLTQIDSASNGSYGGLEAVHVGSNVYVYVLSATGPAYYVVPDTASAGGTRQATGTLSNGTFVNGAIEVSPGSATGTTNVAYQELDAVDGGIAASFFVAPVASASLANFKTASLTQGITYSDIARAPNPPGGRFFGDDFLAINPGLDAQQERTQWVDFLWLDVHGVVRGEQSGVNGLLNGLATSIDALSASPGPRSAQQAAWNVFWSENQRDDAGLFYDALYYNELDCK